MVKKHSQSASGLRASQSTSNERTVLLVSNEATNDRAISLVDLCRTLWDGRWLIVIVTVGFAAISTLYVLVATEWYRSSVLLAPVDNQAANGLAGNVRDLGGLAGLVGINVGRGDDITPIAVLKSRDFAKAFIEDLNLLTVLLADEWDPVTDSWKAEDPSDQPDIRDAIEYFHDDVLTVSVDSDTGLVTLSIDWTDPDVAAQWADVLVRRLNNYMRERALRDAQYNVSYLQQELADTNVASLRQSISNILESELQKLMLAKGNEEFSFRIVDSAQVAKEPESPKRLLIVLVASLLGTMLAAFLVFFRHALKDSDSDSTSGYTEHTESPSSRDN